MNPSETAETPKEQPSPLAIWIAIVFGLGFAILVYVTNNRIQFDGFMRLSSHQSRCCFDNWIAVRFDLPSGWGVKYNGHQPWRGGTVVDANQRPRMEVWIFEGKKSNWIEGELCRFSWGEATLVTSLQENSRPFLSLPQVSNHSNQVVEWNFYLTQGHISFCVPLGDDKNLEPIIWDCMRNLRIEE